MRQSLIRWCESPPWSGAAHGGSVWVSLYATTSNSCCHLLSHLCRFASTISGHFVHIRVTHKTGNAQHIATPTEETRATGHRGYTWARLHSLSCLVPRFSTWRRYPHSLLSAVPASAANRALSSKPVARSCWCRSLGERTVWDRRKEGRTDNRPLHNTEADVICNITYVTHRPTMRTASISMVIITQSLDVNNVVSEVYLAQMYLK